MYIYLTKELAAEVKEVLMCSPQWKLQENTWNTFERGEDILVVESEFAGSLYGWIQILDGSNERLVNDILTPEALMTQFFWAWIDLLESVKYVTPRELVPCEPPF